jgi:diacylglycerol kinase (ATP)
MWFAAPGRNMSIHLFACSVVIALIVAYQITGTRLTILITSMVIVLGFESFNTAMEAFCDLVVDLWCLGHNPRIGFVKDVAAGAVMFVAIGAAINGWIVIHPYI